MKKNRISILLIAPAMFLAACNNNASGSKTHRESGISRADKEILENIESIALSSRPTQIVTRQVYFNPSVGVPLNYLMTSTIEYGTNIEVLYTYSYEKLADATSENFTEVVSGQYYASGTSIAEIVSGEINWVTPVEKALNFPAVSISNVTSVVEADIREDYVNITISDSQIFNIFGTTYSIHNVNIVVKVDLEKSVLTEFDLNYETDLGAIVRSTTTYTYDTQTVNID